MDAFTRTQINKSQQSKRIETNFELQSIFCILKYEIYCDKTLKKINPLKDCPQFVFKSVFCGF